MLGHFGISEGPISSIQESSSSAPAAPFLPGQFPEVEKRKQRGFTDVTVNLLLTTLAAAAVAPGTRAPIVIQQPASKPAIVEQAPNLLLTTLAAQAAKPFAPYQQIDLPAKKRQPAVFEGPNLLLSTLAQAQRTPFLPADWTSAARRKAPAAQDFPNLAVSLAPPVDPGQPRVALVIERKAKKATPVFDPPNLVIGLAQAQAAPFAQTDWPYPWKRRAAVAPEFPNLVSGLAQAQPAPFAAAEFPGTQRAARKQARPQENLLLSTLAPVAAVVQPFGATDWPQYRKPKVIEPTNFPNLVAAHIAPPDPGRPRAAITIQRQGKKAVAPFDPPNLLIGSSAQAPADLVSFVTAEFGDKPKVARKLGAEQGNLLLTTLAPVVVDPLPFGLTEWPVYQKTKAKEASNYPNLVASQIAPVEVVKPFTQTEWPNYVKTKVVATPEYPNLVAANVATIDPGQPRVAMVIPRAEKRRTLQFDPPNLVLNSQALPPPDLMIFVTAEYGDKPKSKPRQQGIETYPNLVINSQVAVVVPFSATEWPAVRAKKPQPSEQYPNLLIQQVAHVSAPLPPGMSHIPGPERKPHRILDPFYFNPSIFDALPAPPQVTENSEWIIRHRRRRRI
jgi:hypothetical protein